MTAVLRPALVRLFARLLAAVTLVAGSPGVGVTGSLPRNWPLPPADLERRFERDPFVITKVEPTSDGRTGALELTLAFADGRTVAAKWKAVTDKTLDDWNSSPRRELASYRMQQLFLDEEDYVVPTAAVRCIPVDAYAPIRAAAEPTLEDSRCVVGVLSAWLKDVHVPEHFFDTERFARDERYARSLADLNLLTYLIDHRDGKLMNFLASTDESDPRSFSVDNGISFESFPWNMEATNWNQIRVPWLRKQSVDRLRSTDPARISALAVVAEMVRDENGIFQVTDAGARMSSRRGVRVEGGRIQFGLTGSEIGRVRERIEKLLREVDEGKVAVR